MPYSLVSAATLGFDLVRLPAGPQVAGVLATALLADAAGISRLAAVHPDRGLAPDERTARAVRGGRARETAAAVPQLRGMGSDVVDGPGSRRRTAVLLAQLEQGTIGDSATIERLLRRDVLGPEHAAAEAVPPEGMCAAADVLADAAVGWWAVGVLPPLVRRELTEPMERAGLSVPRVEDVDLGPGSSRLADLLRSLRGLDGAGRAHWRTAAHEDRSDRRSWATAMHSAAWAAHVSGRTRTSAVAQLLAVLAFREGGLTAGDGARGVWNAVAGCVQAQALADLLDEESLALLTKPMRGPGSADGIVA
jgi:hypothetical protein